MFYPKWMEELYKEDTPCIKEFRHHEYWYLMEIAGAFITWKPRIWIVNVLYTVVLSLNSFYYLPCFVVSVFKVEHLGEIGQYINYTALALIAQTATITMIYNQSNILGMLQACKVGFYDYKELNALTDDSKRLKRQFNLLKKILKIFLPIYLVLVASSVMLSDYIDEAFDFDIFVNSSYVNGVYQNLPLKMWYYHKIETEFVRFLTIISQIFASSHSALVITSAELIMIFCGQELILQQKILQTACVNMDIRANTLYQRQYGKEPSKNPLSRSKDEKLMTCYKYCLKQVVEHHLIILDYAEKYKAFLNWPSGMVVLDGSISIATSALSFMQGKGQPSLEVTSCFVLLAEIASMLILNEIGQTITDLSEDIFDAMYSFQWMDCNQSIQKDFMFMKMSASRPIVLMAGSLTPLNRDTFNTLLSSAYSYLNVMRARGQEQ